MIEAEECARILNDRFAVYFADATVRVEVDDGIIADAAAGGDYVKVRTGAKFSPRDIDILERLYLAYSAGDVREIFNIMLEDRDYFETHISRVIDSSGGYLGLVRSDGSKKPAWNELVQELAP